MINSRKANVYSLVFVAVGMTTVFLAGCGGSMTPNSTSAPASASAKVVPLANDFKFTTINNPADLTFNQLLGINDKFTISGYYGSGLTGHPNRGYTVVAPFPPGVFTAEDFPGSVQTQVTCIDNKGNTGGFWVGAKGVNRGFIEWNGVFTSYAHPKAKATVTQILGLNNDGIAAGFYTNKNGVNHGFTLDQATGAFTPVVPPGSANVTASAINNKGDVVGFYTTGSDVTLGFFFKKTTKAYTVFRFPGSNNTTPFGVNDGDAIVGSYVDAQNAMHGFLLTNVVGTAKFTSIDDPNGIGTTTINGIAPNAFDMVGFFVDGNGNTNGMIIQPK